MIQINAILAHDLKKLQEDVTENEIKKAEIQKLKDAKPKDIAKIRSNCKVTPVSDLRIMINVCKLRNSAKYWRFTHFQLSKKEAKNQTLGPPDLI